MTVSATPGREAVARVLHAQDDGEPRSWEGLDAHSVLVYLTRADVVLTVLPSPEDLKPEYRAVFSYPTSILGDTPDTYGHLRDSREATYKDRAYRPEESHGRRSGTQVRHVTEWEALP